MKIILSLALIAVGIYGLILEYKRRSKEKEEILKRLLANHIMAKDALARLLAEGRMRPEDYFDAMEHLTENTIEIVVKACGTKYVEESDRLMKEYDKKENSKPNLHSVDSLTAEEQVELGKIVGKASYDMIKGKFESLKDLLHYVESKHIDLFMDKIHYK